MKKALLRHACLIFENSAIKSSGIDQLNMSKFSLILASWALFGSTLPHLKPNLCRRLLQLLSNGDNNRVAKDTWPTVPR
jgi:hypothetical protein